MIFKRRSPISLANPQGIPPAIHELSVKCGRSPADKYRTAHLKNRRWGHRRHLKQDQNMSGQTPDPTNGAAAGTGAIQSRDAFLRAANDVLFDARRLADAKPSLWICQSIIGMMDAVINMTSNGRNPPPGERQMIQSILPSLRTSQTEKDPQVDALLDRLELISAYLLQLPDEPEPQTVDALPTRLLRMMTMKKSTRKAEKGSGDEDEEESDDDDEEAREDDDGGAVAASGPDETEPQPVGPLIELLDALIVAMHQAGGEIEAHLESNNAGDTPASASDRAIRDALRSAGAELGLMVKGIESWIKTGRPRGMSPARPPPYSAPERRFAEALPDLSNRLEILRPMPTMPGMPAAVA